MKKEIKKVFDKLKTHIKNIWNIACKIHKKSGYLRIYILFVNDIIYFCVIGLYIKTKTVKFD